MYQLIVTGDTNDADYVSEVIYFKDDEVIECYVDDSDKTISVSCLELINKIVKTLKEYNKGGWRHNWGISEYCSENEHPKILHNGTLSEDEIDLFNEMYCPPQIHTIVKIELNKIVDKTVLFNRYEKY